MLYSYVSRIREHVKGYKTMIFHTLYGVPGILYYIYSEFKAEGVDITPFIPAKYVALTLSCIALVGLVLRLVTTGPFRSKEGLPTANDAFDTKGPL